MIKARVLAGDRELGAAMMNMLRPFVYRRYLDYGSFESLRDMKQLIVRQVAKKGLQNNIKLGAGGIREIEFIGQAFQLIRGGRDPALQIRPINDVLDILAEHDWLPAYVVDELKTIYVFLRDCEHRLQMRRDEQTHLLPADEQEQQIIATAMGFADWAQFSEQLAAYRESVHEHFEQVFAAPQSDAAEEHNDFESVWQGVADDDVAQSQLYAAGFGKADEVLKRIEQLRDSHACRSLSSQGRKRMDRLMPLLIAAIAATPNADEAFGRTINLIEGIAQRTAYIALLVENPMALSQLVKLCAASPWITELLSKHPLLLDELLDARTLYSPLDRQALANELAARLANVDSDDLEAQMDALRHFKQSQVLHVAAADVNADMPLMKVSDHLTDIAEVIVEQVIELAWQYMLARHGRPPCLIEGDACDTGFAVIGYGKMGGIELGYGSDLDLVFLYEGDEEGQTDGKRPLDLPVFYARLAQRMTHLLNTQTHAGILYEIDLRLRPDGASGLLVSSITAFADYQVKAAWTWEHQALVRARFVAGDPLLKGKFEDIRRSTIGREREAVGLRVEVREMRRRMREELGSHKAGQFDLKQDAGGIADIEFLVQYGVLCWASRHPELLDWSDNIRILEVLGRCGLIAEEDGQKLSDIYRAYRSEVHRLVLLEQPARVPDDMFVSERETVKQLWQQMLEQD
jgi:glutamate-ammonia-ligase adenylyltransferase